jgi:hypothetical protein
MPDLPSSVVRQDKEADLLQAGLTPKQPEPVPGQGTPVPPTPAQAPLVEDWQHKYKVLQGKYDREMPELRGVIKTQGEVIQVLQNSTRDNPPAAVTTTKDVTGGTKAAVLNPAEFETYGDNIVSLVETVNGLISENERLRSAKPDASVPVDPEFMQRIERVEKSTDERFYSDLDAACPMWRDLNNDDEFLNWAHMPDSILGVKPYAAMRRGYDARNVDQVSKIFNEFVRLFRGQPQNPPRITVPSSQGGSPPDPNAGAMNMAALLEKMKQGQKDFIARRIDEAKYNEIVAEYQTALKQSRQGQ